MSWRNLRAVFKLDLARSARAPLYWTLLILLALITWGMVAGNVSIQSGSSDIGGPKPFMNSQTSIARQLSALALLIYGFGIAIGAGMIVVRDEEQKIGPLLHATTLSPKEYVWGKFSAVLASFGVIVVLHCVFNVIGTHALAGEDQAEYVGPFKLSNYVVPVLVFVLPQLVFIGGVSYAIGALTRRALLVFLFPTALFLISAFFTLNWAPSWLPLWAENLFGWFDHSGLRWLDKNWIEVDRGVQVYNTQPIAFDAAFLLSRAAFVLVGLGAVAYSALRMQALLRGRAPIGKPQPAVAETHVYVPASLAGLAATQRAPTTLEALWSVLKVELHELFHQPGLYLFVPLIVVQIVASDLVSVGWLGTSLLETSGTLAARSQGTLTFLLCILSLYYTIESMHRERAGGLHPIHASTGASTTAIVLGKVLANVAIAGVVTLAVLLADVGVLLWQGRVAIELTPFAILWGLCLFPTFFLWNSFVALAFGLGRGRWGAYGIGFVALAASVWALLNGHMSWTFNWPLWSGNPLGMIPWSDMSVLELDRSALIWNRLMALCAGGLFLMLALRMYPRRELDAINVTRRLRPGSLLRGSVRLAPLGIATIACAWTTHHYVQAGPAGDRAEKESKDYWKKNLETWKDAPLPEVRAADVDIQIDPMRRSFHVEGTYVVENDERTALASIPITPGSHYENVVFSLDGVERTQEDRAGLWILKPTLPLAPGARLTIGFRHDAVMPEVMTKNGGGAGEFVLPGGVVLTSFSGSFVPRLGFQEGIGIDDDNRTEAKEYADDHYIGVTESVFGTNTPFTTKVRITVPVGYRANSVGVLTSEELHGDKRTFTWESDHPVTFFNVVAGRWAVKQAEGTAIYYHPAHAFNVEEMSRALVAARKRYTEWFAPYPWQELKVSQFPGLSQYAQGFATNITFSESIGFLTESDPRVNAAFLVIAHESAHQWWGNMLNPGKGPGGNILSEGMAHFATILLHESELGVQQRIEFTKRIEDQYGKNRSVDSERPLYKIDGSRAGDTTVTYDKGGWVFWMLSNEMGRESTLRGLQAFMKKYERGPDHPLLQDFVADMRPFASDAAAYDAFTKQWFFEVVVPEYSFENATKHQLEGGAWEVTARVKNSGSGTMPLELEALRGERFPEQAEAAQDGGVQAAGPIDPAQRYQAERVRIVLGAGEAREITLRCEFEPEELVADPDALVLQLNRKKAVAKL